MEKKTTRFKRENKPDFGREKITLLYEDEYIAVIYKPDGMLSVPYPGSRNRTAIDTLEQLMRKKGTFSKNHRPFVVHRLDRDTSGVMMFALTEKAQKKIMDNWQTIVTERLYRAVAENPRNPEDALAESGLIDDEIAYNAHNIGFVPKKGDRPADTAFTRKALLHRRTFSGREERSVYERNLTVKNGQPQFKTISARTHYKIIARGKTHTLFELSLDRTRYAHTFLQKVILLPETITTAQKQIRSRALHCTHARWNSPTLLPASIRYLKYQNRKNG